MVGLQRKAFPKLSELELQELRLPGAYALLTLARVFADTFTFKEARTMEHLPAFVRECTCRGLTQSWHVMRSCRIKSSHGGASQAHPTC